MIFSECKIGNMVYIKGAERSVEALGGGTYMRKMVASNAKIIALSDNGRSVKVQSKLYGEWWFLPSDFVPLESSEVKERQTVFYFDESKL